MASTDGMCILRAIVQNLNQKSYFHLLFFFCVVFAVKLTKIIIWWMKEYWTEDFHFNISLQSQLEEYTMIHFRAKIN